MTTGDRDASASGVTALGELLRAMRVRALLSQERLAGRAGLGVRTIRDLEAGRIRVPRHSTLRLLANALDLDDEDRVALVSAAGAGPAPTAPGAAAVPAAQLPAEPVGFTGRADSLRALDGLLDRADEADGPTAVVLSAIAGGAGVGKTALALHWAHRVADRFGDGQLYVDLRGFGPGPPVRPIAVLAQMLRSLGVAGDKVPVEVGEAAGLYRSLLSGKRMLVLLDNARDAEQVRPLLPGSSGCVVVITSRDRLTGLVASHGARRLTLDVLDLGEAVALIGRILGPERVASEREAAVELARLCARLPLALRIAAANLARNPHHTLTGSVARLRSGDRLADLEVEGDPEVAVRAAFEVSYERLDPQARRLFRLLGLVPGADVSVAAAAALAGVAGANAERLLDVLASAHLIEPRAPDRFGAHDLLRLYARERAGRDEREPERQAAAGRLLAWYLRGADAAARVLYPQILRLPDLNPQPGGPEAGQAPLVFGDHAEALAWLDGERANLAAAVAHAAEHGPAAIAWLLADTLRGYFWHSRCAVEWIEVAGASLDAAMLAGDHRARAASLLSLGDAQQSLGRFDQAIERYAAALEAAERAGWTAGQAAIIGSLGNAAADTGDLSTAVEHHARALALYRQLGARPGEANALNFLGYAYEIMGALRQSAASCTEALALYRTLGLLPGEASARSNLGELERELGHLRVATEHLNAALGLHRELGDHYGEACDLDALARVERDAGRPREALALAEAAVSLAGAVGEPRVQANAHNSVGGILTAMGRHERAGEHHRRALELARDSNLRFQEAEALLGLAAADHRAGAYEAAAEYARRALAVARAFALRLLEGQALTALAAAKLQLGDRRDAGDHARQALDIQREVGHRLGQAHTLVVLGHALASGGANGPGLDRWREALDLLTEIGTADADRVRALLDHCPTASAGAPSPGGRRP